ncbi:Endosulfine-domain-containing protein [Daedalea quercina L-15889]|uniref:mRNA stability protein n=1 Tax=Daedalea quercina L-15889 TaxID=1314783 RepID=A0A165TRI3_9APHY|nr:Endosulfine-domain-containing protein [Daedalea quercina L-15889]
MLPAQRNKVDISKLTEEEQKLFRLYGKLPTHKNILTKMQKDRKYFDSGDYALSKAGVAPQNAVGTAIPNPENIPHASSPPVNHNPLSVSPTNSSMSPAKESPLVEPETASSVPDTTEITESEEQSESAEEEVEKPVEEKLE